MNERKFPVFKSDVSVKVFHVLYSSDPKRSLVNCCFTLWQGRREGPGANFFRVAYFEKFFRNFFWTTTPPPRRQLFKEKNFPDEYDVIAFQRLYLNFSYQISLLCPKNQISCPLRGNISFGPNKKFLGAPRTWGNSPPPLPPSRRPFTVERHILLIIHFCVNLCNCKKALLYCKEGREWMSHIQS